MSQDFLSQFGGANLLTNAKSSALRTMKSGFAKLVKASLHTKERDGVESYSVKIEFDALASNQDGIVDYIRTSRANELAKAIKKYQYLFTYGGNAEAETMFKALPQPFAPINGEDGKIIEIASVKEELEGLRALHGDNFDFIYKSSDRDSVAYAVTVTDAKAYCESLIACINKLVEAEATYRLKITEGRNNFDQVSTITKANF